MPIFWHLWDFFLGTICQKKNCVKTLISSLFPSGFSAASPNFQPKAILSKGLPETKIIFNIFVLVDFFGPSRAFLKRMTVKRGLGPIQQGGFTRHTCSKKKPTQRLKINPQKSHKKHVWISAILVVQVDQAIPEQNLFILHAGLHAEKGEARGRSFWVHNAWFFI